jgi:hypothetical protein
MADEVEESQDRQSQSEELERLRRENEELRGQAGGKASSSILRSLFAWVLIILTCVATGGAVLAAWVHYTALDTPRFVNTVAPLVQEEAVSKAISREAVNRLFDRFDLEARIEREIKNLPEPFKSQASAGSGGARNLARTLTADILKSSAFQTVWRGILSTAHSEAVKGLRATGPVRLNEQGEVVLDMTALLTDLKDRLSSLGLSFLKNTRIPDSLGQVVLYKNSQLGNARKAVNVLDTLFWVLPWAAVVLLVCAVIVADDRRRAVIEVAVGIIIVLVAAVVGLKVVQYHYINPIAALRLVASAMAVASRVQGGLNRVDLGIIILSVLSVIAALVSGPYRWSEDMHQAISLPARKMKRHPEDEAAPGFISRMAWPLRVLGFCVAILLMLYLPWESSSVIAVVCAVYLVYLAAIEVLR